MSRNLSSSSRQIASELCDQMELHEATLRGICRCVAQKIGRVYGIDGPRGWAKTYEKMTFLCSLWPVYPIPEEPYPWLIIRTHYRIRILLMTGSE